MQQAIEKKYQHCRPKQCIRVCLAGISHYEDPAEGCVHQVDGTYDEERHFTLHASTPNVSFIAIDRCLIGPKANAPKRCDCAFYTTHKIAFVEFKLRQPGREREEDKRQETRLEEAAEQLLASILSFEENGFITDHEVEAYAHVGYQPIIPAPTTTLTNLTVLINDRTQSLVSLFASKYSRKSNLVVV